jgi:hypothetical protein
VTASALARFLGFALLAGTLSLACRTVQSAPADEGLPWPFLSTNPKEPEDGEPRHPVGNILARPNHALPFFAYVHNPGDQDWTDLRVVLAADAEGKEVIADGVVARVKKGKTAKVKMALKAAPLPVPPPPMADKDKEKAPPPPPPPPTVRLPDQVYLLLFDAAPPRAGETAEPFKSAAAPPLRQVRLMHPREYLSAVGRVRGPLTAKDGFTLDVTLSAAGKSVTNEKGERVAFRGPPGKLKLDLRPELLPNIDPASLKAGTFETVVDPSGKATLLRASGLKLRPPVPGLPPAGPDRFFVTADGFDRAFWFEADLRTAGNTLAPVLDRAFLNIDVPRFWNPIKPLPVRIEAAGREPAGSPRLLFHRIEDGSGEPELLSAGLPGPRSVRMTLRVGDAGELVVASEVKDWLMAVDAAGVVGTRQLSLSVGEPPVARAEALVTLDSDAPNGLRFRRLPATWTRGKALSVTAEAVDPESGIAKALFYFGDPPPEGKPLPPGKAALGVPATLPTAGSELPVRVVADPSRPAAFTATLLAPDQKGPVTVTARFTNRVGLSEEATATVTLVDPPTTGTIKGKVVQGSTPERPQPGVAVSLKDAAAKPEDKPLATTTTNAEGAFTFKDVKPGSYVVGADKPTDYSHGEKQVAVEASEKPVEVTLSLKR